MQMTFNGFFPPNFMLQADLDHTPLNEEANQQALLLPNNPSDFRGVEKRSMPFLGFEACEETNASDELSDDSAAAVGEKKRRLTAEQVKALERSFELGSKLEPERKMQLARALGMKPRQIAIWFQNRRARWKTKQLEKDYEVMKREFEAMRSENEALQAHNKRLQAEILALKGRETCEPINLNKETEGSCSNRSENTSEINLDISRATHVDNPLCPQQGIPFMTPYKPANMMQLFDNSSRLEVQCPKIEHGIVQDGSFSNMFSNLDDQSAFWTLSENQNFH